MSKTNLVEKAKKHLENRGYGKGSNYNTSAVVGLMSSFLKENETDKIRKLKSVINELKEEKENLYREALFCEKRNFKVERQILSDKSELINTIIMSIELGVIDEVL